MTLICTPPALLDWRHAVTNMFQCCFKTLEQGTDAREAGSMRWKCCHFDESFITGRTGSCRNDNFQCSLRTKISSNWRYFFFSFIDKVTFWGFHRWIPLTKRTIKRSLIPCLSEHTIEKTTELLGFWDVITPMWCHCNQTFGTNSGNCDHTVIRLSGHTLVTAITL